MAKGALTIVKNNLGRNVKELRLSSNMSQANLADKRKSRWVFTSRVMQSEAGDIAASGSALANHSFTHIGDHTTERRKPNDQNENTKCSDNSFRRRCLAGVRSRRGRAQATARPYPSWPSL
jgi:hypothetical protein